MHGSRGAARLLASWVRQFSAQPGQAGAAQHRNLAAVLHGVDDLRFEEHQLPSAVAPASVRVAVKATGICATDIHFLKHVRQHAPLETWHSHLRLALYESTVACLLGSPLLTGFPSINTGYQVAVYKCSYCSGTEFLAVDHLTHGLVVERAG